jgi:lysozyme family protein
MADISKAVAYILKNEDSPRHPGLITVDRGGTTRLGIAQKFHPTLRADFFTYGMSYADAVIVATGVYNSDYAAPLRLAEVISQPIANKLLDIAVNCGVAISAKLVQEALNALGNKLVVDHQVGPGTLASINSADSSALMGQVINLLEAYYRQVAINDHASANEISAWATRAAKPGI